MDLSILAKLVDSSKIGGWVRSGVAAGLGVLLAKWPGLSTYLDPVTQAAIGTVAAGIVVGVWSTLTKSDDQKLKAVEAMPDVKAVIAIPNATDGVGAALADPNRPKVISQS